MVGSSSVVRSRAHQKLRIIAAVASTVIVLSTVPRSAGAVEGASDPSVQHQTAPLTAVAGTVATYTVAYANNGVGSATDVQLTSYAPQDATFVEASHESCAYGADAVLCQLGTLDPGAQGTIDLSWRLEGSAGSIVSHVVEIAGLGEEPETVQDNSSSADTELTAPVADLSVDKTGPDAVALGAPILYSITIANVGTAAASGVSLTDTLPGGVSPAGDLPSACAYDDEAHAITCTWASIAAGADEEVSLNTVAPSEPGFVLNDVAVTHEGQDADDSNNNDTTTTQVGTGADVRVVKTAANDTVGAGEAFSYTISVDNRGPLEASGVEVTDTLPAGVTIRGDLLFDGLPAEERCAVDGSTVTCAVGAMAFGETHEIEIPVTAPQTPGSIDNTATASSTSTDPIDVNDASTASVTVSTGVDVSLFKRSDRGVVQAGENFTYIVDVSNEGPQTATGIVVRDELPAGTTFVSASDGCDAAGRIVTCTVARVEAGDSAELRVVVTAPTQQGRITNTAAVTAVDQDDTRANNDSSTAETIVSSGADLWVLKSDDEADPVVSGGALEYDIMVVNLGPKPATAVVVTDTLPEGVTGATTDNPDSCVIGAGTITCTFASLAVDDHVSVHVSATAPEADTVVVNSARVESAVEDPDETNNTDRESTTVGDPVVADVSVFTWASPDPTAVDMPTTFRVSVDNAGPSAATNVRVTDTFPASFTITSWSDSCDRSGQTVTCTAATVEPDDGVEFQIVATPTELGTLSNTVTVASDTLDPEDDDDSYTMMLDVLPPGSADLSTHMNPSSFAAVGASFRYSAFVVNSGPSAVDSASFTHTAPEGFTVTSAVFDTPSDNGTCDVSGRTVTCAPAGALGFEDYIDVSIRATPSATGTFQFTGTAAHDGGDPDATNDSDAFEVQVFPEGAADLGLLIHGGPGAVGSPLRYRVHINNGGPSVAEDVRFTHVLPDGVTATASSTGASCAQADDTITCDIPSIDIDDQAVVNFVLTPTSEGELETVSSVTHGGTDPHTDSNSASRAFVILPAGAADLSVTKFGNDAAAVDAPYRWTIDVRNEGPAPATDVTLTDPLPEGFAFGGASSTQGTCDYNPNIRKVSCPIGNLSVDQEETITIVATPGESLSGVEEVLNRATAIGGGFDWNESNDVGESTVSVLERGAADVSIEKRAGAFAAVGRQHAYILTVSNEGPSVAEGITLSDTLPAGMTYVSHTAGQGSCSFTAGTRTLSCSVGTLQAGRETDVLIHVMPQASIEGDLVTNSASVAFGEDYRHENDTESADVRVYPAGSTDVSLSKSSFRFGAVGIPTTFYLWAFNEGPDTASGVTVTDVLPEGLTFVSADAQLGSCSYAAGTRTITCSMGSLPVGSERLVTIVATPGAPGVITNTGSVAISGQDINSRNNSDAASITIGPAGAADVAAFTYGRAYAAAGSPYTFGASIDNNGPSVVSNGTLTVELPAGVTYDATSISSSGTCNLVERTLTCAFANLPAHEGELVEIDGTPAAPGQLAFTATSSWAGAELDPTNDSDSRGLQVLQAGAADLSVSLAGPSEGSVGAPHRYRAFVFNDGPATAAGVRYTQTMPDGVTISPPSPSQCTCDVSGSTVTCELGSLAPDEQATINVIVTPSETGDITSRGTVVHGASDPEPENNSEASTAQILPAGVTNISVWKTGPTSAPSGAPFRYSMRVENFGPSQATDVVLTDVLPAGLTIGAHSTSHGACSLSDRTLTCTIGTLAARALATVSVVVTPATTLENTTIENTATATLTNNDTKPADNSFMVATAIVPRVTQAPTASTSGSGTVAVDPTTGEVSITMFRSESAPVTITSQASCPSGATPTSVTLELNALSFPMSSIGSGRYSATIPANAVQSGELIVKVVCGATTIRNDVGQIELFDPSGDITNKATGQPVVGATVTLYEVPGWRAKTGPADNPDPATDPTCQSNLSKAADAPWSQVAPVNDGLVAAPGSGRISPAINPQVTGSNGRYAWDVAAGCWFVKVSAPGYENLVSAVVGVPPAVTDLDLELTPISVSLATNATSRVFGQSVTLSGTLAADCKAGRTVQIRRDVLGTPVAYADYRAPVTTSATGTWSSTFVPDKGANYIAVVAASGNCAAVSSVARTVKVAKKVVLTASSTRIRKGRSVTLGVAVTPCSGHGGKPAILYRKIGTTWRKIATKNTSSTCRTAFSVPLTATGVFRVISPASDADHLAGTSNIVTVRVY